MGISKKDKAKFIGNVNKSVGRTIQKHQLIEKNDTILVGLSGGKDSLALIDILAERQRYIPFKFNLLAAHINVKNVSYEIDNLFLTELCNKLEIPIYFKNIEIDLDKDPKKGTCFVCSWQRRKELFSLAKKLKCNKLALGHHLDDANETFLMNMIYHGSISGMPHKLKMFNGRMELIRPILDQREDKIKTYVRYKKYPGEKLICPFGDTTKRNEMQRLLNIIYKTNPDAAVNLFRSPNKIFEEYLPLK
ncbi:ATP-binding protein [Bacteroidota bacterium]